MYVTFPADVNEKVPFKAPLEVTLVMVNGFPSGLVSFVKTFFVTDPAPLQFELTVATSATGTGGFEVFVNAAVERLKVFVRPQASVTTHFIIQDPVAEGVKVVEAALAFPKVPPQLLDH